MRNRALTLLKWLFKLGVIPLFFWLFFRQVNLRKTFQKIAELEPLFFALAVGLMLAGILIKTYRWHFFFQKGQIRFRDLLKIYFIGQFFNFFLPSSVGGDLSRIYEINRKTSNVLHSLNSVLIERLVGTAALALVAFLASLLSFRVMGAEVRFTVSVVSLLILLGITLVFFLRVPKKFQNRSFSVKGFLGKGLEKLIRIKLHFDEISSLPLILRVFYTSLFFHMTWIFCLEFSGKSLGLGIPWHDYWVFFPMIQLISMIPISINGLGLQEGAFVYFFQFSGIENAEALSLALVFRLINILSSLIGFALFLVERMALKKRFSSFH